ncbi:MAG TPA: S53 family peptidase, partial [Bryobacteraceae bacterium]|nr:S53 family peptidase [Bryobacteraceae bacterium]
MAQSKPAPISPRITGRVNEADRRTLRGNTHPLARPQFDQGPVQRDLPMDRMLLVLTRSLQQEAALQDLLKEQHDSSSPEYHHWLTPDEFGQRFGPADADVQAVTAWLGSHGMRVSRVSRGRSVVEFSGTAGQVQDAFHTEIHRYVVGGEGHLANASDPQVPAALATVVAGVASLHNFNARPQSTLSPMTFRRDRDPGSARPQFTSSSGGHALSPADYAVIYNINPLYQAGINGAGTIIGVVARSNIRVQDVIDFRSNFGLSNNPPQIVVNGPDPGDLGGGEEAEAVLDASWSGATAPGATVKLIVSGSTNTTDGVLLSEEYIIDNNLADVMTESFGTCEANFTQAQAAVISALAEQAVAQGITYAVAAGDSGSAGCDDPNTEIQATGALSVNILASTPYTVAVGGTRFEDEGDPGVYWNSGNAGNGASARSYIPEETWSETCTSFQCPGIWAGGGGVSRIFSKPAWQRGVAGIPDDGARDVPDLSLTSAGHDPYLICLAGSCQATSSRQIQFAGIAGTSAATPAFAGIMAMVKQKTGARQGQANYKLYSLAATENLWECNASTSSPFSNCIFNDVTSGGNNVPGQTTALVDYLAGTGYDLATGLGSPNVTNLVNEWNAGAGAGSNILISIDVPGAKQPSFSGLVQFAGWAFSNINTISTVTYAIDGVPYGAAIYGSSRTDVCAAIPNRIGCPYVGWSFLLDTTMLADGLHSLDIAAASSTGQSYTASSSFAVANTVPPMRIWIDSPNSKGGPLSGPAVFAGWAIDDFAALSWIGISIDGVPQGSATYGAFRPDVCAAYPGRSGCPDVGWSFPLDTSLLPDGLHTLEVTGTSVGGRRANSTTTFQTSNAAASSIRISVDKPNANSAPLGGIAALGGWAIDDAAAIRGVAISVDGVPYGNASYGGERPDVCSLFSGRAGCPNVGWNALIDTQLLTDGSHTLQVTATSAAGQHSAAVMPFRVANLTGSSIRTSIDNPTASGGAVIAGIMTGGWAMDDKGSIVRVAVSVDGVEQGNAIYGANRLDVCAHFPGRAGCPNVGWNFPLDTTPLSNGTHTFEVTAYSSTGAYVTTRSLFHVANWVANPTRISIDRPNSGAMPLTGLTNFGGWAVDDYSAITNVSIAIDGLPYGNAIYGGSRPDVCARLPGRFGCPNVGWNFAIDTSVLTDGVHLLEVTTISSEGWRSTATATFTVANLTTNGLFIAIDQPSATDGPVNGMTGFAGWAIGNTFPATAIQISIDGVSNGNAQYGWSRPDVCRALPYAAFCPNVGWNLLFDTTQLSNGPHRL